MSSEPQEKAETTSGGPMVPRSMLLVLVVFFLVYTATVLATGEPSFLIPVVLLAGLVFAYAGANRLLTRRIVHRDGSLEDAVSDAEDPVPSAHLAPDSDTPLGDTPEAHDELSPHDLPLDHPGRQAAEAQAGGGEGTTRGNVDPSEAGEGSHGGGDRVGR